MTIQMTSLTHAEGAAERTCEKSLFMYFVSYGSGDVVKQFCGEPPSYHSGQRFSVLLDEQ